MAKLKAATRNKLPASAFGLPGSRAYPMPDKSHAINAKARAAEFATPSQRARIDAKANRIIKTGNTTSAPFPRVGGAGPTLGSLAQRRGRRGG